MPFRVPSPPEKALRWSQSYTGRPLGLGLGEFAVARGLCACMAERLRTLQQLA